MSSDPDRCSVRQRGGSSCARSALLVVLLAVLLSACSTGSSSSVSGSSSPTSASEPSGTTGAPNAAQTAAEVNGATTADTDSAGIEWLCRPGQVQDPCRFDLTATVVPSSGSPQLQPASAPADAPIDCFYVYPTVSEQHGVLANLRIDPAEISVAESQASRFSQVCRVYAPIYPQLTLNAILNSSQVTAGDVAKAFAGVVAAWKDYLDNYNHGRGVVVIGHSQGASMLIGLLRSEVDSRPAVRHRLVSALLKGGNVTVPIGKSVGGSFQHIPACKSTTETGCVVAYSSFDQPPPSNSLFGRVGQGVSSLLPGPPQSGAGLQVLCVNPASLSGGSAPLSPYFPSASVASGLGSNGSAAPAAPTPWVAEPGLYTGRCEYSDGASWLQVSAPIHASDPRQVVSQVLGPTWGLHLVDVNIALGNLVKLVGDEARSFTR